MSKLHTEKRIKAVNNVTNGSEGDPVNFEQGDIVYDLTSNSFKKKTGGGIGSGSWSDAVTAGGSTLDALTDVDLAGLSVSDIGNQLTYSYIDPNKVFTWRTGTTITVTMTKTGKRGSSGNAVVIDFTDEGASSGGVSTYDASFNSGAGKLHIKYENNVTTATQIKAAIDGVADFTAVITGTGGDTANNADGGLVDTQFAGGAEKWMSDAAGGGGGGTTNLSIGTSDATTLEIVSSSGTNVSLPLANGTVAGIMSDADKDKLNAIANNADVTAALADAKGDIYVATGNDTLIRLPVGTDDHVLTVDSGESSGVKWASVPGTPNLSNIHDVAGYAASDVGKVLELSYVDAQSAAITWGGTTTLVVTISEAGRRGSSGNVARVTVATGTAGATWNASANGGNGELQVVYANGSTTAASIKSLIESAGAFTVNVTNADSQTASSASIGAGPFNFSGGSEQWQAKIASATGSSITLNDTAVTITDTGSNGNIEFKIDNSARWNITSSGHLLPALDDTYDIGSATHKVRDLYVADDSLWIGDQHKIMIQSNQMKFRRRKHAAGDSNVPQSLKDAIGGSSVGVFNGVSAGDVNQAWVVGGNSSAFNYSGCSPNNPSDLSQFKLQHWKKVIDYVRSVDSSLLSRGIASLFSGDSDFATTADADSPAWGSITGKPSFVTNFTGLSDTPGGYASSSGDANKFLQVNADGDGIIFSSATSIPATIGDLSDVPNITNSDRGKFVKIDSSSNAAIYTDVNIGDLANVSATGASNGQVLQWSGSEWAPAAAGGGSVNISGTPADNQLAIWSNSNTIEGDQHLFWISGDKELQIAADGENYTALQRTTSEFNIKSTGHNSYPYLLTLENGNKNGAAGAVALNNGANHDANAGNNPAFFGDNPSPPVNGVVTGHSKRWYRMQSNSNQELVVNIEAAVDSSNTKLEIYFQFYTEDFQNDAADDIEIFFRKDDDAALSLAYELFKEDGSAWARGKSGAGAGSTSISFDPRVDDSDDTSNAFGLADDAVHWLKLIVTNGSGNVSDLAKIAFKNTSDFSASEKLYIANLHVSQPVVLTQLSSHKDGFIQLHQEINDPPAPSAGQGGKLYVKTDGKLNYRSDAGTFDLTEGIANVLADTSPQLGGDLICDDGSNENTNTGNTVRSIKHVKEITFRSINGGSNTSGGRIYATGNSRALYLDVAYGKAERDNDLNAVIIGNKAGNNANTDEDKGNNVSQLMSPDNTALYLKAAWNGSGSAIQINNGLTNVVGTSSDREGIEFRMASDNSATASVSLKPAKLNTGAANNTSVPEFRFYNPSGKFIALKAPIATTSSQNYTFTLPPDDGDGVKFLQTDSNGILSWGDELTVTGDGVTISNPRSYFQFMMINSAGNQAGTVTLSGTPTLATDTSNTIGFATTQPTAPTSAYAWSDKYYEINSTVEYVEIDVSSAIGPGDTSKDFYFQLRTEGFENEIYDDALIKFFDSANQSIELKWTVYKQSGSNWTSIENHNGTLQVSFDPVAEGLANNTVHWIKVVLQDGLMSGNEDVVDLAKLRFFNHGNDTPSEKLQIANFFIDGENFAEAIETQFHRDGFIAIKEEQESDPPAPNAGEGGKLYTKSDGKLHFRSNAGTFDLTGGGLMEIPDLSWAGGFNTTASSEIYLPVVGFNKETTQKSWNQKIMLKAGKITQVVIRSRNDLGSTVCTFIKNNNGGASPTTVTSSSVDDNSVGEVNLKWRTTFNFNTANTFALGDVIALKLNPTNAPSSDMADPILFSVLQMITL